MVLLIKIRWLNFLSRVESANAFRKLGETMELKRHSKTKFNKRFELYGAGK